MINVLTYWLKWNRATLKSIRGAKARVITVTLKIERKLLYRYWKESKIWWIEIPKQVPWTYFRRKWEKGIWEK